MKKVKNMFIVRLILFLVLITGTMLACNTQAQDAGKYPDIPNLFEPTTDYPFNNPFNPPVADGLKAKVGTPQIAEWTRQNNPGDTMAITGESFSLYSAEGEEGRDTRFIFYGEGVESDGMIQRQTGRKSAVTLPTKLPPDEVYLMWPRNDLGVGEPVVINAAIAKWVGSDLVWPGQTFSVYGKNLDLGDGLCRAYIKDYGWIPNVGSNPYKVDFEVPKELENGKYTIYVHNGRGGRYGWSEGLEFSVRNPIVWDDNRQNWINVKHYGAVGDGKADDTEAMLAALGDANDGSYQTLYFPEGIYKINKGVYFDKCRIKGDGMNKTVIMADESFLIQSADSGAILDMKSDCYVEDLEVNTGDSIAPIVKVHGIGGPYEYQVFNRVKFSAYSKGPLGGYGGDDMAAVNLSAADYVFANECVFELASGNVGGGGRIQHHYRSCEFIGADDNNALMSFSGEYSSLVNCSAHALDVSSPNDDTWCKGRWMQGGGTVGYNYFAGNVSSNMFPRQPTTEWWGNVIASSNGVPWKMPLGTMDTYWVQVDSDFDDVKISNWPDSTKLDISGQGTWEMISADRESRWIRVWNRGVLKEITSPTPATLCENVDDNAGEQFMWEAHATIYDGKPTKVIDAVTIHIKDMNEYLSAHKIGGRLQHMSGNVFTITAGRGIGQYALIEGEDPVAQTITLASPLRISPDSSSTIKIGRYMHDLVFYDNDLSGLGMYVTNYSATVGVSLYGGSQGCFLDGNTFSEMESGAVLYSTDDYGLEPCLFNVFKNNTAYDTRNGFGFWVKNGSKVAKSSEQMFLCNIMRGNTAYNNIGAGMSFSSDGGAYQQGLGVFDSNVSYENGQAVKIDSNLRNQVWVNNTITANENFSLEAKGESSFFLRGNTWNGVDANNLASGGVLTVPRRVIDLEGAKTPSSVTLWNSGAVSLSWFASTDSTWLKLLNEGGSVGVENGEDDLSVLLGPVPPEPGSQAIVTIVSGAETQEVTVVYSGAFMPTHKRVTSYSLSDWAGDILRAEVHDGITDEVTYVQVAPNEAEVRLEGLDDSHWYLIDIQNKIGEQWFSVLENKIWKGAEIGTDG